jgi:hypothetical protein
MEAYYMEDAAVQEKQLIEIGIKKHTKTREQLEKEIIGFLSESSSKEGTTTKPGCPLQHGRACMLATVYENIPRATPADFFSDGLTIWIAGEPGLKIRNIRSNPKVAVGIYHPMDHSILNRSLQIQGTATLINLNNDWDEFMKRVKMFGIYAGAKKIISEMLQDKNNSLENLEDEVMKALKRFNLIRIESDEIIFLSIDPVKGTEKDMWQREGTLRAEQ